MTCSIINCLSCQVVITWFICWCGHSVRSFCFATRTFWPEWKQRKLHDPFRTIVRRSRTSKRSIWTTRVYYLLVLFSVVSIGLECANGSWMMSCRLQPGSDEWCCRCLLWSQRSWRIGGLKGAEIHSSMCSASESCLKAFFSAPSDVLEKHCNKPGYPHMTGSRITAQCQVKGSFIIKAQGVLWCQMWLI